MSRRRARGEGSLFKRTRKRKDGSTVVMWAAEVTIGSTEGGKQKRKTVYGSTQREVLDKIAEIKGQLAEGTFSDTRTTISAYLAQWLSMKKLEVKPRSYQYYSDYIRLYINPHLGRIELSRLSATHIEQMMKAVAESVSKDAANKARNVLTGALKKAVRQGLIPRNPAEAVDRLTHEPREMTLWTPDQVLKFLEIAEPHRLYAAFYLALTTGMRHGEILGLRWQDIEDDVITVRQSVINVKGAQYEVSTPKTKRGIRRVVIDPATLETLNEHRQRQDGERLAAEDAWRDSGLVFTNELGDMLVPRNFDRVWYGLLRKSGNPKIRFHDLRHLHVSLLVRRGLDPRTVADRVGHTDPAFTLKQYSHMFESQRRTAAVGLDDLLKDHHDDGPAEQGAP